MGAWPGRAQAAAGGVKFISQLLAASWVGQDGSCEWPHCRSSAWGRAWVCPCCMHSAMQAPLQVAERHSTRQQPACCAAAGGIWWAARGGDVWLDRCDAQGARGAVCSCSTPQPQQAPLWLAGAAGGSGPAVPAPGGLGGGLADSIGARPGLCTPLPPCCSHCCQQPVTTGDTPGLLEPIGGLETAWSAWVCVWVMVSSG